MTEPKTEAPDDVSVPVDQRLGKDNPVNDPQRQVKGVVKDPEITDRSLSPEQG